MGKRWALISVWDKTGVVELGRVLSAAGLGILATSKSAAELRAAGLAVTEVSEWTGALEILGGRVKTLHPKVAAGILSRREDEHIELIDVVVCNLYPFADGLRRGLKVEEMIELIDIGGVTLLRAAAKNWEFVTPVPAPEYYPLVMSEFQRNQGVSRAQRLQLAAATFDLTSNYDKLVSGYLKHLLTDIANL
jgi:phosphoribosylaminoimidazolecarboxamide formyltransferase/IMP cyclohydrolase|uniref:MGS-like domain-containing protein n=1 Tax=candidate division WOR-3 bacterium TaxID=2052148 RepID=A0A7V3V084_UNCW3